jgi:hypothetical protein
MFEIMQKDVIRVWIYMPQDATFGMAISGRTFRQGDRHATCPAVAPTLTERFVQPVKHARE